MNLKTIITIILIMIVLAIIYFVSRSNDNFLELLIIGLIAGIFVELFFARKQRRNGKKDLVDIIARMFNKS